MSGVCSRTLALIIATFLGIASTGSGSELRNWWPGPVIDERPAENSRNLTALGPFFAQKESEALDVFSIRPLFTRFEYHDGREAESSHLLYPLFNHYSSTGRSQWSLLNLIRNTERSDGFHRFQAWPFLFWNDSPQDEQDYFALWPLGGSLKNFFGRERVDFALWPLYIRTERRGEIRYSTPWPFVQTLHGEASGFALWPLYGHFERPGVYERRFALWPLYYDVKTGLSSRQPYHRFGALPFYARETAAGMKSETFLWPFFGYTHESDPRPAYDEIRYFYPFLVQGRGEERHVNRWMPFYTHERSGEREKWWYLWPLLKHEELEVGPITRHRSQFLYFLFRDEVQVADNGFRARRQNLWPFYSYWQDGHGRRQLQALDLFSVFFPGNRKVQENWNPLFAIYRYDEHPGKVRQSFLWSLIIHESSPSDNRLVIGPLFEQEASAEGSRWSVLKGLVGRDRAGEDKRWRILWHTWGSDPE